MPPRDWAFLNCSPRYTKEFDAIPCLRCRRVFVHGGGQGIEFGSVEAALFSPPPAYEIGEEG